MTERVPAPSRGRPDSAAKVDGVPAPTESAWRYAVYFAPRAPHPLAAAARRWLGRDAEHPAAHHDDGAPGEARDAGIELAPDEWRSLVAMPSRYGFHATLKPPFRPARGVGDDQVLSAVRRVAASTPAFAMPALAVERLDGFLALRPANPGGDAAGQAARLLAVRRLADICVRSLDDLRGPPDAEETARRLAHGLDVVERSLLARWGYPYVMARWRLHLTLTRRLGTADEGAFARVLRAARAVFDDALSHPLECADICVFVEPVAGADLVLRHRVPLG